MEKFEKIATRLFEKAIEENDNPYSITSKIMWWELFFNINRKDSLIEALSKESMLIDLFDAELHYYCENENKIPIAGKLQKIKISFLKNLMNYFRENKTVTINDLNVKIIKDNYLDIQLIKEFTAFTNTLENEPDKIKNLIKDYQKKHTQIVSELKKELEKTEASEI